MKQRLISAFFGIILLILVLLANQVLFDVIITIITAIGIYEVLSAIGLKKQKLLAGVSIAFPFFVMPFSYVCEEYLFVLVAAFVLLLLLIMLFCHKKIMFSDVATAFISSLMVTLPFFYVSMTRRLGNENLDVLVILIGCWITDSCAYFSGYFFGKHKLAPEISPKKTIEGSVGGVLGVLVIMVAYSYVAGNIMNVSVNLLSAGVVGFVAGIFSQFGDLCASVIKREHNIKDYGKLMPGHGGVMDRFDSLLFVAPITYYILKFFPIFIG